MAVGIFLADVFEASGRTRWGSEESDDGIGE